MQRELSDAEVMEQAYALFMYTRKPGNRGASFWLDSKLFMPADRAAIVLALGDVEEETFAFLEQEQ